jgi:integrase
VILQDGYRRAQAMAPKELMGWVPSQKRWKKNYRGTSYWVSPRQLGCDRTRDASRSAANRWWEAKQAEIDAEISKAPPHPPQILDDYARAIENHRRYAAWNRRFGSVEEAAKSEKTIEILNEKLASSDPEFPLAKYYENPLHLILRDVPKEDQWITEMQWIDRYRHLQIEEAKEQQDQAPTDDSTVTHIDAYLKLEYARHSARNKISAYYNRKQWLNCFRNWAVVNAPKLTDITEDAWEAFFIYLAGLVQQEVYTGTTAANYQAAARWFIDQRYESKRIANPPRNLRSKKYCFSKTQKDPVPFTKEEVKLYLDSATEWQKLFLLLMLNIGMYPSDIGQLLQTEVDWEKGRIARKRTKTRNRSAKVPRVDYPLWPETFRLLRKFRNVAPESKHPKLALVNHNDAPLWQQEEKKTKKGKTSLWNDDNIKSAYQELQSNTLKLKKGDPRKKPLASLRKTGATFLMQSEFGLFHEHFLGEAPSTIATMSYVARNGPRFDLAVQWLGKELGIT